MAQAHPATELPKELWLPGTWEEALDLQPSDMEELVGLFLPEGLSSEDVTSGLTHTSLTNGTASNRSPTQAELFNQAAWRHQTADERSTGHQGGKGSLTEAEVLDASCAAPDPLLKSMGSHRQDSLASTATWASGSPLQLLRSTSNTAVLPTLVPTRRPSAGLEADTWGLTTPALLSATALKPEQAEPAWLALGSGTVRLDPLVPVQAFSGSSAKLPSEVPPPTSTQPRCRPASSLPAAGTWKSESWGHPAGILEPTPLQLEQALEAVIALPADSSTLGGLPTVQQLCRALHAQLPNTLTDSAWLEMRRLCNAAETSVATPASMQGSACAAFAEPPAVSSPCITDGKAPKQARSWGSDAVQAGGRASRRGRTRRYVEEDSDSDYMLEEDAAAGRRAHRHRTPPRDRRGRRSHKRIANNPWTPSQTLELVDAVERCGCGRWADIKRLRLPELALRSTVDLKDKWRNLQRTACLAPAAMRAKCAKKRETPMELVLRVRALCEAVQSSQQAAAKKPAKAAVAPEREQTPRRAGLRVRI